ncbi:hypothetical protein DFP72DRAFT_850988 [Ephemerocybe angulata]|uniref:Uncharacterized protein n=1 Tax=Ephemerocybe angulata TaxID=980116 RepID=A0A8H6M0W8_9AGAR|nr:hypothetical protein DFP72DRAFT_850988 [Tulosesus angulatus]
MPPSSAIRRSRTTSHMSKASKAKLSGPYASPLRPDSEESDDTWSDAQSISSRSWQDLDISELDDPMDHNFQSGDRVWVRTQEHNWRMGKVVKGQPKAKPLTRNAHLKADYYQVQFGAKGKLNTRKYFAPLNGELKPDNLEVRGLLLAGGWISGDIMLSD